MRVVSSKDEINTLDQKEGIVHLAFRPSNQDIFSLAIKCSEINSYSKFLYENNIQLFKDAPSYPRYRFDHIKQYIPEGMPEADIIEKLTRENQLSPDLVVFLVKNS